jgi:hypothetical protein
VYRVVSFCFVLRECTQEEREKIIIAGSFHDLGIWAADTFDYLPPSAALATDHLRRNGLDDWSEEIGLMIGKHHKLRQYTDQRFPLVEVFRRADLADFSLGLLRGGVPSAYFKSVTQRFPNAGFHKRLVRLEVGVARPTSTQAATGRQVVSISARLRPLAARALAGSLTCRKELEHGIARGMGRGHSVGRVESGLRPRVTSMLGRKRALEEPPSCGDWRAPRLARVSSSVW